MSRGGTSWVVEGGLEQPLYVLFQMSPAESSGKNGSQLALRETGLRCLPLGSATYGERMLAICLQSDTLRRRLPPRSAEDLSVGACIFPRSSEPQR